MARELQKVILMNAQLVYTNRMFEAETVDMAGAPLKKPTWSVSMRYPKTTKNWFDEPLLASLRGACGVIKSREMSHVPFERIEFPVKDGDLPNKKNKIPAWAAGHWIIRANTTIKAPLVEQRVDGVVTALQAIQLGGQRLWGDGDYAGVVMAVGKRLTDDIGIKCYLNSVCFMSHGEPLNTAGEPTDWDIAVSQAAEQGINIRADSPGFNAGGFPPSNGAAGGPAPFAPFNPSGGPSPFSGAGPKAADPF
jgi:hypothetical protein